eukprot:jgi/Botrbrau1/21727/Bobra.43_1s0121.1
MGMRDGGPLRVPALSSQLPQPYCEQRLHLCAPTLVGDRAGARSGLTPRRPRHSEFHSPTPQASWTRNFPDVARPDVPPGVAPDAGPPAGTSPGRPCPFGLGSSAHSYPGLLRERISPELGDRRDQHVAEGGCPLSSPSSSLQCDKECAAKSFLPMPPFAGESLLGGPINPADDSRVLADEPSGSLPKESVAFGHLGDRPASPSAPRSPFTFACGYPDAIASPICGRQGFGHEVRYLPPTEQKAGLEVQDAAKSVPLAHVPWEDQGPIPGLLQASFQHGFQQEFPMEKDRQQPTPAQEAPLPAAKYLIGELKPLDTRLWNFDGRRFRSSAKGMDGWLYEACASTAYHDHLQRKSMSSLRGSSHGIRSSGSWADLVGKVEDVPARQGHAEKSHGSHSTCQSTPQKRSFSAQDLYCDTISKVSWRSISSVSRSTWTVLQKLQSVFILVDVLFTVLGSVAATQSSICPTSVPGNSIWTRLQIIRPLLMLALWMCILARRQLMTALKTDGVTVALGCLAACLVTTLAFVFI